MTVSTYQVSLLHQVNLTKPKRYPVLKSSIQSSASIVLHPKIRTNQIMKYSQTKSLCVRHIEISSYESSTMKQTKSNCNKKLQSRTSLRKWKFAKQFRPKLSIFIRKLHKSDPRATNGLLKSESRLKLVIMNNRKRESGNWSDKISNKMASRTNKTIKIVACQKFYKRLKSRRLSNSYKKF